MERRPLVETLACLMDTLSGANSSKCCRVQIRPAQPPPSGGNRLRISIPFVRADFLLAGSQPGLWLTSRQHKTFTHSVALKTKELQILAAVSRCHPELTICELHVIRYSNPRAGERGR